MKKILSFLIVFALMSSIVLAATITGQAGTKVEIERNKEGDIVVKQTEQTKAETSVELKQMIQERQQEMEQAMAGLEKTEKNVLRNQNQIRTAVHALLAMEDLVGGIGKQVSAIAKDFDNSVQATINAEERIAKRSSFARMFAGGDEEAAKNLEAEVESNKLRIQQLKELKNQCDCGSEVKAMFQEQIANMEQEQERLGKLAKEEKDSKGLFGWLWK